MSNVLPILIIIGFFAFVMWLMVKRDRADRLTTEENPLEFVAHKLSPSRKLKMLTDKVQQLEDRRIVPDQTKVENAIDSVQEILKIVLKAQFLYQHEMLQCFNGILYMEESKSVRAKRDPPEIHLGFPFSGDMARAVELTSRPVHLSSDPPNRLQVLSLSLPPVDRWLRRKVQNLTTWLNFACDVVERHVWPVVVQSTDYTWLTNEAVDFVNRFIHVQVRVNGENDQTVVTIRLMVPVNVKKNVGPNATKGNTSRTRVAWLNPMCD